jgi:hypothetical protein
VHHFLRTRRISLAVGSAVLVVVAAVLSVAAASPAPSAARKALPVAQLVSIANGMVAGLGDPTVKRAWVIATTKNAAENATYPGSSPPDPANPRAYLIAVRGHFVCHLCSGTAGSKAPRGIFAYDIWVPGQGVSDFGLQPRVPHALSKLGRIVNLRLVPPQVPASEVALQPGAGIGPVRLGVSTRTLNRTAGPAIAAGQYVFGPIRVDIRSDRNGRVDRIVVLSAQATVDGHPLSDGYARLLRELIGWSTLHCRNGPHVLQEQNSNQVSTWLQFAAGRFDLAFIGAVPAGACWAPFN